MLKGIGEGILIEIKEYEEDIKDLKEKLENKEFFTGNTDFVLSEKDKAYFPEIWEIINKYGHNLFILKEVRREIEKCDTIELENKDERKTLYVRKTLRSGQKEEYDGNIVIIGDVNPGAEVIATGDIYVFGKARGLLHAGSKGDTKSIILALALAVKQLRIAGVFAQNSAGDHPGRVAEKAFIDDNNQLILEEFKWLKEGGNL